MRDEASTERPTIVAFMTTYLPGTLAGGPVRSVQHLVDGLSGAYDLRIVTRDRDLGSSERYADVTPGRWIPVGGGHVWYVPHGPLEFARVALLAHRLQADVVYPQSLFSVTYGMVVACAALLRRRPVTVLWATRGELSPGALKQKAWKKRPVLTLHRWVGRWSRRHARIAWHASTVDERSDIVTTLHPRGPVHVAADVPRSADRSAGGSVLPTNHEADGRPLRVLFLSRIVPKKNLLGAIDIVARTRATARGIVFAVAGPKEDAAYWTRCRRALDALPPHVTFVDLGPVPHERVGETMADHDLLLFPTEGENYGHVVREAWSVGTPVLLSDTTPWRDLATKGLGWDLSLARPDAFAAVLDALAEESASERMERRSRVRTYEDPAWSAAAALDQHRTMFEHALAQRDA